LSIHVAIIFNHAWYVFASSIIIACENKPIKSYTPIVISWLMENII
jgi:hypothetical protein